MICNTTKSLSRKFILDRMERELDKETEPDLVLADNFARLVSLTQSAKNCKRNVQKYFHDILNRVVVTVKDELVNNCPTSGRSQSQFPWSIKESA